MIILSRSNELRPESDKPMKLKYKRKSLNQTGFKIPRSPRSNLHFTKSWKIGITSNQDFLSFIPETTATCSSSSQSQGIPEPCQVKEWESETERERERKVNPSLLWFYTKGTSERKIKKNKTLSHHSERVRNEEKRHTKYGPLIVSPSDLTLSLIRLAEAFWPVFCSFWHFSMRTYLGLHSNRHCVWAETKSAAACH